MGSRNGQEKRNRTNNLKQSRKKTRKEDKKCTWDVSILVFCRCRGHKIDVAFFPKKWLEIYFWYDRYSESYSRDSTRIYVVFHLKCALFESNLKRVCR